MEKGKGSIFSIPLDCIFPINHLPQEGKQSVQTDNGTFRIYPVGNLFYELYLLCLFMHFNKVE